jgi:hypothetical protein
MRHDLMPLEVEIDPILGAAAFITSEYATVKPSSFLEVIDGEREMESRALFLAHGWFD